MNIFSEIKINIKKYYYLISILVSRDIKKKYKGSMLGILWSLLNPLLQMGVLTIIFSSIFKSNIDNYPLYMISGRLLFEFFSIGTNAGMRSIVVSASLLKKVYIPKYIVVISKIISSFIIFIISMLDLILVMIITGVEFRISLIYVPLYLILLLLFVIGVGMMLATIMTIFRDIEHIYSVATMILMYFSAIFYPIDIIPEKYQFLMKFNPLHYYIEGVRTIIYDGQSVDLLNLLSCLVIALIFLTLGFIIFRKNEDKFILYI